MIKIIPDLKIITCFKFQVIPENACFHQVDLLRVLQIAVKPPEIVPDILADAGC